MSGLLYLRRGRKGTIVVRPLRLRVLPPVRVPSRPEELPPPRTTEGCGLDPPVLLLLRRSSGRSGDDWSTGRRGCDAGGGPTKGSRGEGRSKGAIVVAGGVGLGRRGVGPHCRKSLGTPPPWGRRERGRWGFVFSHTSLDSGTLSPGSVPSPSRLRRITVTPVGRERRYKEVLGSRVISPSFLLLVYSFCTLVMVLFFHTDSNSLHLFDH